MPDREAVVDALHRVLVELKDEERRNLRAARIWNRTGIILGFAGALGAGLAGAFAASSASLTGALRTIVAIVAFLGAGLSAASGASGYTARADEARLRWLSLRALRRRVETLTDVDSAVQTTAELRARLDWVYRSLDLIEGAKLGIPDTVSSDDGSQGTAIPESGM